MSTIQTKKTRLRGRVFDLGGYHPFYRTGMAGAASHSGVLVQFETVFFLPVLQISYAVTSTAILRPKDFSTSKVKSL